MSRIVNINGKICSPDEARISVFDRGFLFGDSIYETMRTYRRKVFLVDRHLQRLQTSASLVQMDLPLSPEEMKRELSITIEGADYEQCYIRLIVTRGPSDGKITLDRDVAHSPNYVIIANPFEPVPEEYYRTGVKLALVSVRRNSQATVDPKAKTGNLMNNLIAFNEAKKLNAFEGIFCNLAGYVTEGSGSNIFMVKGQSLITPPLEAGLLPGITRGLALDLAQEAKIPVNIRNITPDELLEADECFITGTTKGILPARCINNTQLPAAPGSVTSRIMQGYKRFVDEVK